MKRHGILEIIREIEDTIASIPTPSEEKEAGSKALFRELNLLFQSRLHLSSY